MKDITLKKGISGLTALALGVSSVGCSGPVPRIPTLSECQVRQDFGEVSIGVEMIDTPSELGRDLK